MKRTPLARDTPKARKWASGRRTPLKSRSARRRADKPPESKVKAAVFVRDELRCLMATDTETVCGGPLTYHHRRKASAGGAYIVENGATLCADHNVWVEDNPVTARRLGLVVREGDPEWQQLGRRANR